MKNQYKRNIAKNVILSGVILVLFSICIFQMDIGSKNIRSVASNTGENQKLEWGIKRNNNHERPDVGDKNKQILEANGGICLGKELDKNIYLTFDSGYEAGYMENILDVLKQNNVKATFFITSHYLNTASELVGRMIEEGHIIGNHTVNHKSMPSISNAEIETEIMKLHQAVFEKFNYEMRYIRPPKGEFNERTLRKCQDLGYKTVMWSFAYCDWDEKKQPSQEKAQKMIVDNLHSGEIMLLHSNSKTNSEVLDAIIKEARNQGYEFKTLDEFEI